MGIHVNDPEIIHQDGEYFSICHNCDERVVMESITGGPSGQSFRVKPNQ